MLPCSINHSTLTHPLCESCDQLVPFNSQANPFDIFSIKPRFFVAADELENRFFAISRKVHPDKFAGQDRAKTTCATQWYAALSVAYATLKDPIERAKALFKLADFTPANDPSGPPADLIQFFFQLKSSPPQQSTLSSLLHLGRRVEQRLADTMEELGNAFKKWEEYLAKTENPIPSKESSNPNELLQKAANAIQQRSYLMRMKDDLELTCQKLSASI